MLKSGGRNFKYNSDANIERRMSTRKLIRAMVNHECTGGHSNGFIDELYGAESTLDRDVFIQSLTQGTSWIFASDKIRARFVSMSTKENLESLEGEYYDAESNSTLCRSYGH